MFESKELKMPSKKMLSVLFMQNGAKAILIAVGGIIIFLILGLLFSYKFFILCLVWLFFISPMEIAFLYFYYGMRPLTAFNTIPHTIDFSPDKITYHFIPLDQEEKEKELEQHSERTYHLETSEYQNFKTGPDYVLLFFGDKGWIWLPVDAFEKHDDFKTVISILQKNKS